MTNCRSHGKFEVMETVDVKLPSALLRAANLEEGSLSEEAARLLALELYREDKAERFSSRRLRKPRNDLRACFRQLTIHNVYPTNACLIVAFEFWDFLCFSHARNFSEKHNSVADWPVRGSPLLQATLFMEML